MPNITVTCPACKSGLEIDAEYEGQEIECGSCLKVFVAKADKRDPDAAGRSGSGNRSRRSDEDSGRGRSSRSSRQRDDDDDDDDREDREDRERRRRRDDDDDDDDRPRRNSAGAQNPLAVASLVLGILSVLMILVMLPMVCLAVGCCCPPLAWLPLPLVVPLSLGAIITGALGLRNPDYKAMAIIGIVLGVLCLLIAILQLAFGFLPFLAPPVVPPPQPRAR